MALGKGGLAQDVGRAWAKVRDRPLSTLLSTHYEDGIPVYRIPQGVTGHEIPKSWMAHIKKQRVWRG